MAREQSCLLFLSPQCFFYSCGTSLLQPSPSCSSDLSNPLLTSPPFPLPVKSSPPGAKVYQEGVFVLFRCPIPRSPAITLAVQVGIRLSLQQAVVAFTGTITDTSWSC